MTKKQALFPGTFSPPTLGHLDLIKRAVLLFDTLYVGIAENVHKADQYFSTQERMEMVRVITQDIPQVKIVAFDGLVADFCHKNKIPFVIRGLRGEPDFKEEFQMSTANKQMRDVETLFLITDPKYMHISSTLIREIAHFGHRLDGFVPKAIEGMIFDKLFAK